MTIRLTEAENTALAAEAKRRDRSLSYLAREYIRAGLGLGLTHDEEGEEAEDDP